MLNWILETRSQNLRFSNYWFNKIFKLSCSKQIIGPCEVKVPFQLGLATLLVLTITTMNFGAQANLPKVSYVKALDVWFIGDRRAVRCPKTFGARFSAGTTNV